jgi:hypothetical protein
VTTVFDRLHPAFGGFFAGCLIMAAAFGTVAVAGYDPMPDVIYGGIATDDALAFACLQAFAALVGLLGCLRRRRFMTGLGGAALGLLFVVLASAGAVVLPGGAAVMAMSFGAAPLAFAIAFYSWGCSRGVGR